VLYFLSPSQRIAHGLNYGQRSFVELLENRVSRNASDIISYCIQNISWSNNGLFLHVINARGNASIVSRLGEFVWIQEKSGEKISKPSFFMNSLTEGNLANVCQLYA
jgi:hypothetical protein